MMDAQFDGKKEWEEAEQAEPQMLHQCAWCLRLMNEHGEPIASRVPSKLYEATHGMCSECGEQWVADVMSLDKSGAYDEMSARDLLALISLDATASSLIPTAPV